MYRLIMEIKETKEDINRFEKETWDRFWKDNFGLEEHYAEKKYKILEEGTMIGYISTIFSAGVLRIKEIMLDSEHRGGKRGHSIMEFIDKIAHENKCHKIRLETSPEFMPNAYHLYKKYGFRDETVLKDDWFHKEWIIMSKFIDDS